ncbi:MAG: FliO/MopB family protein [Steroidobacterales bacterium]
MNPAQSASPFSFGSLAQLTLSLLVIIGLILALSWLLKRFRIAVPHSTGSMMVLDEVAVSPRDRVVLVGVGALQVLVGVGANGVVALTPLAEPVALNERSTPPGGFADRLRELMSRPGKSP